MTRSIFRAAMNPLRPSSSNDIARAGRAFKDQYFYRRLYDSSPLETTGSSGTLRLALSEPNTETNLTNMDRFSAGSSTQFQAYNNNHDLSGSSESYRFHAAAGPYSRRPNNDNNADMSFLNQRWIHSSDLIHSLSLSDKSASQSMDPPSRIPDQHSTPIHQPVMAADNTLDLNKTKKKHGCWMCHKSFDRPRYAVYTYLQNNILTLCSPALSEKLVKLPFCLLYMSLIHSPIAFARSHR